MGAPEMTAFLNHLAVQRRISASTQNQALCALVFLYRRVLGLEMPGLEGLERARRPEYLPAVLSCHEVLAVLGKLDPPFRLIVGGELGAAQHEPGEPLPALGLRRPGGSTA
jgi:hypothetical protein